MRISDWSSDVCSSDLPGEPIVDHRVAHRRFGFALMPVDRVGQRGRDHRAAGSGRIEPALRDQILIGEHHGLAIDAENLGELAAAGKIGAGREPSALYVADERLDDLHIDGNVARGVDPRAETDLPWP